VDKLAMLAAFLETASSPRLRGHRSSKHFSVSWSGTMVMISGAARSRIRKFGKDTRAIQQSGIPFNIPVGVPIANPFVRKQMLFRARYKVTGVTLEEVREGVLFANFRDFMDMKMETFSRTARTRHFKINPFKKKFEEVLGSKLGKAGTRAADAVADSMVAMLGLVEWEMSEEPITNPDLVTIHIKVTSRFFGGHFKFRISREPDGVIVDDEWRPEGGGDVRAGSVPMANLVLATHPLGFEQIVERAVEEILQAQNQGRPYVGQIGPPSEELK
jgi:hypothetical protein